MAYLLENGSLAQEKIQIRSYDCDCKQTLRPSALLRYLQEIAGEHCALFGMDYDMLYENDGVFLIVRQSLNLYELPKKGETVLLQTWHRKTTGAQFIREMQLLREDGTVLTDSTSVWVLAHVRDHKIWRPSDFTAYNLPHKPEPELPTRPGKLRVPDTLEQIGVRPVRYTDLDYNGHVNNCVYADFLCDFMPGGMHGKQFATLDISYIGEAKEGDCITIYAKEAEDALYFRGEHARGKCFEARCTFHQ